MQPKKPSQLLRDKLRKRAIDHVALANAKTPKHLLKSPSQKKSENIRKKELKRAGVITITNPQEDCHTCPKQYLDGKRMCPSLLSMCGERTATHRCKQCGARVRYRFDPDVLWEYCPICLVRRRE